MIRIVTQILIGLMLFFGVATFTPKILFHYRNGNMLRALYFAMLWGMSMFFSVMAFYYSFLELTR